MTQLGPTPKNEHWQNVVLVETGVLAGTYQLATVTVNEYGQIVAITGGNSAFPVVPNETGLPTINNPDAGDVAVVLDDGTGSGVPAFYIYDGTDWENVTGNAHAVGAIRTLKDTISADDGASQQIGLPVPNTLTVKRVHVTITTVFSPGTTIAIRDNAGNTIVESTYIDPTVAGVYTFEMLDNNTPVGLNNRMFAVIGGTPTDGEGHVLIEFA